MNGQSDAAGVYLDSSALLKLLWIERESVTLRAFLNAYPRLVSSALARVEVGRALKRSGATADVYEQSRILFARMTFIDMGREIIEAAAEVAPPILRSLDAIHLATVRSLGASIQGVVAYDVRLQRAIESHGFQLWVPS